MVSLTQIMCRNPVIKFRIGGVSRVSKPSTASAAAAPASVHAQVAPAAHPMSTGSIPDIDIPLRYRRRPLSDEEIAHINGGGIV